MKNTQSLCLNYRFRQLYNRGKSQVAPNLVVYCSKNREKTGDNRLGLTVSTKVGKAVIRNAVRRKLREAYRLNEDRVLKGLDIVIVARTRASSAQYKHIEKDMLYCFKKLGILTGNEEEQ
ncbi:MAG: ribonuclease P protein component [Clostridia bacterium]|nr:ribonuclease P protein component [Clostridia bacterium]MBR5265593.1 ribonuclease P protein component [Clostridia bacterium]